MEEAKRYYAKLMLVGEYGVILGGNALTVPLPQFSATGDIRNPGGENADSISSINHLRNLLYYLQSLPKNSFFAHPELQRMNQKIKDGFYVASDVKEGYGIGSSGVVSALVYDRFFTGKENLTPREIWKDLATIESFFHGRSSGVDAMSCYTGKPLLFSKGKVVEEVNIDLRKLPGGYRFFLLDSGSVFDTGPLVKEFTARMKEKSFSEIIYGEYLELNSILIEILTGKREGDAGLLFRAISDLQYNHFRPMIPDAMEDLWIGGQVSNTYYLKLNGSGGGYMLGLCHEDSMEVLDEELGSWNPIWI